MKLYHVTTPNKVQKYHQTGFIRCPVRGFNTPHGALIWAHHTGRSVILELEVSATQYHKLVESFIEALKWPKKRTSYTMQSHSLQR